jgi:hypothetical protein
MINWSHCFWACGEAEHDGRSTWWNVAHGQNAKTRGRAGRGGAHK